MALMVINNFNLGWPCLSVRPFKTDAPLLIDANGILPCPVAFEPFQPVAGQGTQGVQGWRGVQNGKPPFCLSFKTGEGLDEIAVCKSWCLFTSIAQNHCCECGDLYDVRQASYTFNNTPIYLLRTFPAKLLGRWLRSGSTSAGLRAALEPCP